MQPTDRDSAPGRVAASSFDPFELPDTIQLGMIDDPYPQLAAARRKGSVQVDWPLRDELANVDDGPDAGFNVLGYDEVVAVLRDHETYSSKIVSAVMGPVLGPTMVAMDEPEHRANRALVARAFGPKLLARWEQDLIRRVLDELIDSFAPLGHADLVRQLTFAFPVRVIARILGLPDEDSQQFQRWSIELISAIVNWDRGIAASLALGDYFGERLAERRAHPQDDLMSELVEAEVDGERLTDEEIFGFLRLLLPAGIETTYRSLGNLLFALLTHPEQLDDVVQHTDLRPAAIEEGLRWQTPLVLIARECVRDAVPGWCRHPCGERHQRLHRFGQPRREAVLRARSFRHPPIACPARLVRIGTAHVSRHPPRPHGEPDRARCCARTTARPSSRPGSTTSARRGERVPVARRAPGLLPSLTRA